MSQSNLQKQISQMQSKLDSKRSRSKTPVRVKEKANSKQKNHQRRKGVRGPSADGKKLMSNHANEQRRVKYANYGGDGDGTHGLDFAKARACVEKIQKAHIRAREAKLEVWDHMKRVELETKMDNGKPFTRFQTHKEFKVSVTPKSSLLAKELAEEKQRKTAIARCNHPKYDEFSGRCKLCGVTRIEADLDSKDVKVDKLQDTVQNQLQELYDAACQEFEAARNLMRSTQGNRPIKFRLSAGVQITATVTSGVVNTVLLGGTNNFLTPTYASEWATCAALFDEYKLDGGHLDFVYTDPPPSGKINNYDSLNYLPVIAFDPADNTATSACLPLTELEHHEVLTPIFSTTVPITAISARHKLSFRVPPGPAYGIVAAQAFYGRIWVPTDDTAVNFGAIKFYHVGNVVTATNVGVGFIYYNTEFRCRE